MLTMGWIEAIETLMRYFRVKDQNSNDLGFEVVIDGRLDLKIVHLENDSLAFFGYFTEKILENDLKKIKNMLQWNLARIAETDDTLSIESESNRLCLFRKRFLSELFMDNIFLEAESFIINLEFWADSFDYSREILPGSNLTVFGF